MKKKVEPMNFSRITDYLYVGTQPREPDYRLLHEVEIDLILNMRAWHPPVPDSSPNPIASVWIQTFDSPFRRIPTDALMRGVAAAREVIAKGGTVYVHCRKGRQRSVAMACAILIAQGYGAEEAASIVKLGRPLADPDRWYIKRRIKRFEQRWKGKQGGERS